MNEKISEHKPLHDTEQPIEHPSIEQVFQHFERDNNGIELMKNIKTFAQGMEKSDFEALWDEEKLNTLFETLRDDNQHFEITYPQYFNDFLDLFCSGEMNTQDWESHPFNEKVAAYFLREFDHGQYLGFSDFDLNVASRRFHTYFKNDPTTEDWLAQDSEYQRAVGLMKTIEFYPDNVHKMVRVMQGAQSFFSYDFGDNPYIAPTIAEGWAEELIEEVKGIDNYFIQIGIDEYVENMPLSRQSTQDKRMYLKNFYRDEDLDIGEMDDQKIEREFIHRQKADVDFFFRCQELQWQKNTEKYNDENLKQNTDIRPLTDKKDVTSFGKITKNLGVIYDSAFEVDSFFTDGPDGSQQLTLQQILENEGFDEKSMRPEDYQTLLMNYKMIVGVKFREHIEKNFGIRLENFDSVREQLQFLTFLSQPQAEVERVKNILSKKDEAEKLTWMVGFLSRELEPKLGNKILEESEKMDQQEDLKVFEQYSKLTREILGLSQAFMHAVGRELKNRTSKLDISEFRKQVNAWSGPVLEEMLTKKRNDDHAIPQAIDLVISKSMAGLANAFGTEELRSIMDGAESSSQNPKEKEALHLSRPFITPLKIDQHAITNLEKFYQHDINFFEYAINEKMFPKELEILKSQIHKTESIMEIGTGPGRFLRTLFKEGYNIQGFDFVQKHVDQTREAYLRENHTELPSHAIQQADWHNMPYEDESFDVTYSVGRNILHDYLLTDQLKMFSEAARILKPGGKFIFDIPNREKGYYQSLTTEYARVMEEYGIDNYRYGTIYDSPDKKNFATRYCYSEEDIALLAQEAGFKIHDKIVIPLDTGHDDEDWYFVLEKI